MALNPSMATAFAGVLRDAKGIPNLTEETRKCESDSGQTIEGRERILHALTDHYFDYTASDISSLNKLAIVS